MSTCTPQNLHDREPIKTRRVFLTAIFKHSQRFLCKIG
jgi:hypothetical protein